MIRAWVQTHPKRISLATERLLPGLAGLEPELVVDDEPGAPFPWRGYQRCLQRLADAPTPHGVVLQDDAVVCRNFSATLERIVERHPNSVIALFVHGGPIKKAIIPLSDRYGQLKNGWYLPCVGVLWPRAKAIDVLEWEQTAPKKVVPNDKSDDGFLGLWAKRRGERIMLTLPSLVQHPDDVPSVLERDERRAAARARNGQSASRCAFEFIGVRDPLELDW